MKIRLIILSISICFFTVSCETLASSFKENQTSPQANASGKTAGTPVGPQQPLESANKKDGAAPSAVAENVVSPPDSANWNIEILDTARNVKYLSSIEKDVILEMNKARTDPPKYAKLYIQPELGYYNGNLYQKPGQIAIRTQEGRSAAEACIAALSKMAGVAVLTPELGLSLAAKDQTADQGKSGKTGHDGSDGSSPFTRMQRYGKGYTTAGENIAYGAETGRDIVVDLLIDDGVPSRGHRTNIMDKDFTQAGVSVGPHPQYRSMCVIEYANGYVSN